MASKRRRFACLAVVGLAMVATTITVLPTAAQTDLPDLLTGDLSPCEQDTIIQQHAQWRMAGIAVAIVLGLAQVTSYALMNKRKRIFRKWDGRFLGTVIGVPLAVGLPWLLLWRAEETGLWGLRCASQGGGPLDYVIFVVVYALSWVAFALLFWLADRLVGPRTPEEGVQS